MKSERRRILGWVLIVVNGLFVLFGLATGQMGGLADLFAGFPDSGVTFARHRSAFLLGMAAHAACAAVGVREIVLANRAAG